MSELELHTWIVRGLFAAAALTVAALLFVTAPYGRHRRAGWGPELPDRLAWIVMETPAVVWFLIVYFAGSQAMQPAPLCMLALWQLHYVHRTYIYPFRIRTSGKTMPLVVMAMAFCYQLANSYVNARWLSELGSYPAGWLRDPRFVLGSGLFLLGFALNFAADTALIRLREGATDGYRIPGGPLFRWVTCPNYLGELIEWWGWAVLTWSGPGLAFAVYATANLAPRALANHRWYRQTFPAYPAERRALIPFVW
jgi:3-oxo-5-alpha-steroid 4-dehydrogenase 1